VPCTVTAGEGWDLSLEAPETLCLLDPLFGPLTVDGGLIMWLASRAEPQAEVPLAHEGMIWSLAWHKLGHVLASGENRGGLF
jgi:hypothetical protein